MNRISSNLVNQQPNHHPYLVLAVIIFSVFLVIGLPLLQVFLATDDFYGHRNPHPVPEIADAPIPNGGVNLVFFGFSGCAQTCPMQLANLMELQPLVDPEMVHFVYVALDADRHKAAEIDATMRQRGPSFRGVVPKNVSEAKQLALAYGGFASERGESAPEWERFAHDGRLYVVNDDNLRVLTYLTPTLDMQKVGEDIDKVIRRGS